MSNQRILIKYGGNAMINPQLQKEIASQIFKLQQAGFEVIMVHGGGPFINKALEKAAITSKFIDGLRVTEAEAFSEIQKALIGDVNANLISVLNHQKIKAVGLSGKDAGMVRAEKYEHLDATGQRVDLGLVGEITSVDDALINLLCREGYVPVVACIADSIDGQTYNINADTFAGKLASALKVNQLIVLTDVDGLFLEYPDPESIIHQLDEEAVNTHMGTTIQGGMIPKIKSCMLALKQGVGKAIILNGTKPEQITAYAIDKKQIGTTLTLK
jgi:acetylglutamate kinase